MVVPRYLTNSYDIGHVVLWISSMLVSFMTYTPPINRLIIKGCIYLQITLYNILCSLFQGGPQNQAQKQLNGLFSSIASFYHPSNNGRWLVRIEQYGAMRNLAPLVLIKVQPTPWIHSRTVCGVCCQLSFMFACMSVICSDRWSSDSVRSLYIPTSETPAVTTFQLSTTCHPWHASFSCTHGSV